MENSATITDTTGTWLQLAICLKDDLVIGDIGIHFLEDAQVEIGYTITPDHQGNGYATEAVRAVMDYLFSILMKHRITESVDPDNMASVRLLEKIGFRKEAHFIQSFRMGEEWRDNVIFAMLSNEWEQG